MPDDPIFDSTALNYAADANFDVEGDDYDSTPTKVEPSAGIIAQGIRPERQLAAQYHAWVMRQFALIMTALIGNDVIHEVDIAELVASDLVHDEDIAELQDFRDNHSPRIKIYPYLASGTFGPGGTYTPAGRVVAAIAAGCGGGAGGGRGAAGIATENRWIAGGAGGGGSIFSMAPLPILDPTALYNFDVGAAGVGATVAGGTGGDGGDSIFRLASTVLAAFCGAAGGRGAAGNFALLGWVHYTMGGGPRRGVPIMTIGPAAQGIRYDTVDAAGAPFAYTANGGPHSLFIPLQPGQGGFGAGGSTNPSASAGGANPFGSFLGGTPGIKGVDDGDLRGGGGGGGGGAGPFGAGGAGGSGASVINAGSVPGAGAANSGAGGGGSGSGCGDPGNTSLVGANGGSGRGFIITVEESA